METYQVWHAKKVSQSGQGNAEFPADYLFVAFVRAKDLQHAFELASSDEEEWWLKPGVGCLTPPTRSSSTGDVILDQEYRVFQIEPAGFRDLTIWNDPPEDVAAAERRPSRPTFLQLNPDVPWFELCDGNPAYRIVVGWDVKLRTYFSSVWEKGKESYPAMRVGNALGEITSVDHLAEIIKPYASLPKEVYLELVRVKEAPTIELAFRIFQSLEKTGKKDT